MNLLLAFFALIAFFVGVLLGGLDTLPREPGPMKRLAKGAGVFACLYGTILFIGAMLGGESLQRPIPPIAALARVEAGPRFVDVETVDQLERLVAQAGRAGQPVMVDFTADWCGVCKELENSVFPDPAVVAALAPFLLLRADMSANNDDDRALRAHFGAFGMPTIAFFDRSGRLLDDYEIVGMTSIEEFGVHVNAVAALRL